MSRNSILSRLSKNKVPIFIIFYLIIWLSYFLKIKHFGIYEDDTRYIADPANADLNGILELLKYNIINFEGGQGRFIGFTLPHLLAFIMFKLGGLTGVYVFGTVILLYNAILVFSLAGKFMPERFAFLASILYLLYPIDTTKILLVHLYQLQISLAFTLTAMNLFLRGNKYLSYFLAFCSLLTYEVAFLPFLMMPLLERKFDRKVFLKQVGHVAICGSFFILIFTIRKITGEQRISNMEDGSLIKNLLLSVIIGPAYSALAFPYSFMEVFKEMKTLILPFLMGLGVFSASWFYLSSFNRSVQILGKKNKAIQTNSDESPTKSQIPILQFIIVSFLMLLAAYLLAFVRFPPAAIFGRATSVHLASSIAGSLLIAGIFLFLFSILKSKLLRNLYTYMIITFFALLYSYAWHVQSDYANSWKLQQSFWTEIDKKPLNFEENSLVIVTTPDPSFEINSINTFSWSFPEVFQKVYKVDDFVNSPPKFLVAGVNFDGKFLADSNGIYLIPEYPFLFEERELVYMEDRRFYYLEFDGFNTVLIDTLISVGPHKIQSSLSDSIPFEYPKHNIAKYFINQ